MKVWRLASALMALASVGSAQDVAPGVALLAYIKAHMRDEIAHLPDYTCLETISRFHKEADSSLLLHERLKPLDTVRLEIVYSDHHEWYGSPGESSLGGDDPAAFVGSGLIGNGAFASTLNNILAAAVFSYQGEQAVDGRAAVRYDFLYPRFPKGFEVSMVGGAGTVGQRGSLWADPQSLDLIRLESYADDIPLYLPLAAAHTTVNYTRTQIGDHRVLLAQQAEIQLSETTGVENYDRIEFTHCRAFSSQSALHFDEAPEDPAQSAQSATKESRAALPAAVSQSIPANQMVTVQLTTPVTSRDAVGSPIEARVVGAVLRKGLIVIPDGAAVRGRIRRLERFQGSGAAEFIVGIEFTEVDATGGPRPFYADLLRLDRVPGVRASLSERTVVHETYKDRISDETITLPELPGVASFFVGGETFAIPGGFRTVWRTRGPIRTK